MKSFRLVVALTLAFGWACSSIVADHHTSFRFVGQVRSIGGSPVSGASVKLVDSGLDEWVRSESLIGVTDARGAIDAEVEHSWGFTERRSGQWQDRFFDVVVEAPGFESTSVRFRFGDLARLDGVTQVPLDVALRPSTGE